MQTTWEKLNTLKAEIAKLGSALVAFSGGVDSTFLLKVAHDVLKDHVLAVTAVSETYPMEEIEEAKKLACLIGVKHLLVETCELNNPEFNLNPPERCYFCKNELFSKLAALAREHGLNYIFDGANANDDNDYRPGRKAAKQHGVKSLLKEVGLTKKEIRYLSKEMGLPTWDKPSFACLASRFPYGTKITADQLHKVEMAERFLRNMGFKEVRVRHYGDLARIEVTKEQIPGLVANAERVVKNFKEIGYTYVTCDLEGYRMGSMNEQLKKKDLA